MAKRSKLPTDVNSRAKAIVDFATSDEEEPEPSPPAFMMMYARIIGSTNR